MKRPTRQQKDEFGQMCVQAHDRAEMLAKMADVLKMADVARKLRGQGQGSLFPAEIEEDQDADESIRCRCGPWTARDVELIHQAISDEFEITGLHSGWSSLQLYAPWFGHLGCASCSYAKWSGPGADVSIAGAVHHLHEKNARRGAGGSAGGRYLRFTLTGSSSSQNCVLWPDRYQEFASHVVPGDVIAVSGEVEREYKSETEVVVVVREVISVKSDEANAFVAAFFSGDPSD